jgi:hypothetical protein
VQPTIASGTAANRGLATVLSLAGLGLVAVGLLAVIAGRVLHRTGPDEWRSPAAPPAAWQQPDPAAYFEPNRGQAPSPVRYLLRGQGYDLQLDPSGVWLLLQSSAAIHLAWAGNATSVEPAAEEELPERINYLLGLGERHWLRELPAFRRIRYRDLYPGIDLLFSSDGRRLDCAFIVADGANPSAVTVRVDGAEPLEVEESTGDLLLHVRGSHVRQHRPVAYQDIKGARAPVDAHYALEPNDTVSLRLGMWDRRRPIVIAPSLDWSRYLGTHTPRVSAK